MNCRSPGGIVNFGTVAITGAAGTIGSAVRATLREDAARLILMDRVPMHQEAENEDTRTVDLRDAAAVEAAMAGADRVLHLGGVPDEAPLPELLEANVLGTHHVLEGWRGLAERGSSAWCWPVATG
ncbi:NAD-dependent epimerase/dehydratase family protein [Streptomyces sp. NPDC051597]|uniref:NAD-dependent epimerase/dehydratase family protein n=1 Tax=Streptomyces sp. NPDC051597 TaxID=3155049 RepID=UPI003413B2A4